jgi:hypothetical protein
MISDDEILKLNNGVCDGGRLNTIACGFDDGDCITFNLGKKIQGSCFVEIAEYISICAHAGFNGNSYTK